MIEGCLANVPEWHREHTWITWYIRDGRGDLRPLWHKNMFENSDCFDADLESEERWRGYDFFNLRREIGSARKGSGENMKANDTKDRQYVL